VFFLKKLIKKIWLSYAPTPPQKAKVAEFTLEKQNSKIFTVSLSKNGEISPEKNLLPVSFVGASG